MVKSVVDIAYDEFQEEEEEEMLDNQAQLDILNRLQEENSKQDKKSRIMIICIISMSLITYLFWIDLASSKLTRKLIISSLLIGGMNVITEYIELHHTIYSSRIKSFIKNFQYWNLYIFILSIFLSGLGGYLGDQKGDPYLILVNWFPFILNLSTLITHRMMKCTRIATIEFKSKLKERKSI
ncbi:hypothetical protein CROQUDRAFT_652427 [Cronartium quercuum f. sp. fusiforme G11]|uniref:Uncharacterized protein n=1 Tax=Cronartium quercuum f. sp. fusiforme G11 TaxID=708437 RepID=A0A9P6TG89_9BASI|nr:hypothetical protein CROQUDRAFT_652427 [Cronartium quercuum f. sp. fusiforme G11]